MRPKAVHCRRVLAFFIFLASLSSTSAEAGVSLSYKGTKGPVCAKDKAFIDLAMSGKASAINGFFVRWHRNGAKFFEQNIGCKGAPSCTSGYLATPQIGPGSYKASVSYTYLYLLTGQQISETVWSNEIKIEFSPTGAANSSFTLNGSHKDEIVACFGQPLLLNGKASACYSGLFVSVQRSDQWWNRYGTEAMRWLKKSEWNQIGNLDVPGFAAENGLPQLSPNTYYRVKLAVGEPWNEKSRLVLLKAPDANFTLNGSNQSSISVPANVPLTMNGSSSECAKRFFVSVQESDTSWNRYGPEYMRWLKPAENQTISSFDIKAFVAGEGGSLSAGKYYRIKLATGEPWNEEVKLVFLKP